MNGLTLTTEVVWVNQDKLSQWMVRLAGYNDGQLVIVCFMTDSDSDQHKQDRLKRLMQEGYKLVRDDAHILSPRTRYNPASKSRKRKSGYIDYLMRVKDGAQ